MTSKHIQKTPSYLTAVAAIALLLVCTAIGACYNNQSGTGQGGNEWYALAQQCRAGNYGFTEAEFDDTTNRNIVWVSSGHESSGETDSGSAYT